MGSDSTDGGKFRFDLLVRGEPLPPHLAEGTPANGASVRIGPDGSIMHFMFMSSPAKEEIHGVAHGRLQVRILTASRTLLFLFKYGGLPWQEGLWNAHRAQKDNGPFPLSDPGEGMAWVVASALVDSDTMIVRAMRDFTLSRRFCVAVLRAVEAQLALPEDDAEHAREVAYFARRSVGSLAADAHIRFVQGETAS